MKDPEKQTQNTEMSGPSTKTDSAALEQLWKEISQETHSVCLKKTARVAVLSTSSLSWKILDRIFEKRKAVLVPHLIPLTRRALKENGLDGIGLLEKIFSVYAKLLTPIYPEIVSGIDETKNTRLASVFGKNCNGDVLLSALGQETHPETTLHMLHAVTDVSDREKTIPMCMLLLEKLPNSYAPKIKEILAAKHPRNRKWFRALTEAFLPQARFSPLGYTVFVETLLDVLECDQSAPLPRRTLSRNIAALLSGNIESPATGRKGLRVLSRTILATDAQTAGKLFAGILETVFANIDSAPEESCDVAVSLARKKHGQENWAPLCDRIIKNMETKNSLRTKNTLRLLAALFIGIGTDFAIMLPELMSPLARLSGEKDETIQETLQSAVAEIERALGQSIEKYIVT